MPKRIAPYVRVTLDAGWYKTVLTLSDQIDDALRTVIATHFDAHSLAAGLPSA